MRYLFILSFFIVSGCDVNREVTPITQIPDFTQPADFPIPDSPMDTTVLQTAETISQACSEPLV